MPAIRKDLIEHLFTIVAAPSADASEHVMDFTVYQIMMTPTDTQPMAWAKDSGNIEVPVTDLADASVYLHGHVKWDGCSNWHFDAQDRCMLHFCGKRHVDSLAAVLAACYEMAKALPMANKEMLS